MEKKTTYIYGLSDGDKIGYIGKSDRPLERKVQHLSEAKRNKKTQKDKWINKTIVNNKTIDVVILEEVPIKKWEEREVFWINKYGIENLTNIVEGGQGGIGYPEHMRRTKNLKIYSDVHKILKDYCNENDLKMMAFVERLIKENCKRKKLDFYGED